MNPKMSSLIAIFTAMFFLLSASNSKANTASDVAVGVLGLPISVPAAVVGGAGLAVYSFVAVVGGGLYNLGETVVDRMYETDEERVARVCYYPMNRFEHANWEISNFEKEYGISKADILNIENINSKMPVGEVEKNKINGYRNYLSGYFPDEIAMLSKLTDISSRYLFKGKLDSNVFSQIRVNDNDPEKIDSEENIKLKSSVVSYIKKLNKDNPQDRAIILDIMALGALNSNFSIREEVEVCASNGAGVSILTLPQQTNELITLLKSKMK